MNCKHAFLLGLPFLNRFPLWWCPDVLESCAPDARHICSPPTNHPSQEILRARRRTRSASPLPFELSLNTYSSRTMRLEHRRASAFAAWMRLMPNAAHGLPLPCRLARPLHRDVATQQHSPFPSSNFRSPTPQLGEEEVRKASLYLECLGRPGLKHSPLGQPTSNSFRATVEESLGLSSAVLKAFSPLVLRFWGFDSLWLWHIGNWKLWR